MERLTDRDLKRLLLAVSVLRSQPDAASLPARIVAAVTRTVPADVIALDSFDPTGQTLTGADGAASDVCERFEHDANPLHVLESWVHPADHTPPELYAVLVALMHEHPFVEFASRPEAALPTRITDVTTTRRFQRTGIYNEFFRQVGIKHLMSTGLPITPDKMLTVALNRSAKNFTDGERGSMAALRPHLIAAYRDAEIFARLQTERDGLRRAAEDSRRGVIITDAAGRVRLITEQARVLLARHFAAPARDRLPGEVARWLAHHTRPADGDEVLQPAAPLLVAGAGAPLRIRLLADDDAKQNILVLEEQERRGVDRAALSSFGLTSREAEVLGWVAQGKSNADIAVLCGISIRTVGKHLEHVFTKLGVETRTAAARRVLEQLGRVS